MTLPNIEDMYLENKNLLEYLEINGQVSFKSQTDNTFKKVLLLACASNLEYQVTEIITTFAKEASNNCEALLSFVKNKAITRQYHTFFNWENNNANQFFGYFGPGLKDKIKTDVSSNAELDAAIRAFLEIGNLRNTMVHEDFISFYLDKTAEEVFMLYIKSQIFIVYLSEKLSNSIPKHRP